MRFLVVAVGHRMPAWVDAGFSEYAGRMPRDARVGLVALKPALRGGPVKRVLETEGKRILAALPAGCVRVALDERGALFDTMALARRIARWREGGRDVAFVVGGADGLAEEVKRSADLVWSLSPLTLPHGLARVALAEQLYRAMSILHNHPYHRE
ncbi:MAG: 23S rRNA (pseudouridine(1915)-N(3))-methyltransferase RlmH [Betaproteobacteria bacterium RIFCSPLOWO2_02_FULL_67_26]|nr:MAG: 23S rRNA (pseudouridine(1915)-N(3))-methyltransferase RlmH [Betaproteobacteria bacterium RIFCSPLOWO2_02_FULL_67_26]